MKVRPSKDQATTCALCKAGDGRVDECPGCGTLTHAECLRDLSSGRCPTIRCEGYRKVRYELPIPGRREGVFDTEVLAVGSASRSFTDFTNFVPTFSSASAPAANWMLTPVASSTAQGNVNLAAGGSLPAGHQTNWYDWRTAIRDVAVGGGAAGLATGALGRTAVGRAAGLGAAPSIPIGMARAAIASANQLAAQGNFTQAIEVLRSGASMAPGEVLVEIGAAMMQIQSQQQAAQVAMQQATERDRDWDTRLAHAARQAMAYDQAARRRAHEAADRAAPGQPTGQDYEQIGPGEMDAHGEIF